MLSLGAVMVKWPPDLGLPHNLPPEAGLMVDLTPGGLAAAGYFPLYIGILRLTFNGLAYPAAIRAYRRAAAGR